MSSPSTTEVGVQSREELRLQFSGAACCKVGVVGLSLSKVLVNKRVHFQVSFRKVSRRPGLSATLQRARRVPFTSGTRENRFNRLTSRRASLSRIARRSSLPILMLIRPAIMSNENE